MTRPKSVAPHTSLFAEEYCRPPRVDQAEEHGADHSKRDAQTCTNCDSLSVVGWTRPASAQAFFRRTRATAVTRPAAIVTNHHQPYVRAARQNLKGSLHIRTGLHRLTGETTKPIERRHIATRDRLRARRGLKTTATGQRFLEGFEAVQAL